MLNHCIETTNKSRKYGNKHHNLIIIEEIPALTPGNIMNQPELIVFENLTK